MCYREHCHKMWTFYVLQEHCHQMWTFYVLQGTLSPNVNLLCATGNTVTKYEPSMCYREHCHQMWTSYDWATGNTVTKYEPSMCYRNTVTKCEPSMCYREHCHQMWTFNVLQGTLSPNVNLLCATGNTVTKCEPPMTELLAILWLASWH